MPSNNFIVIEVVLDRIDAINDDLSSIIINLSDPILFSSREISIVNPNGKHIGGSVNIARRSNLINERTINVGGLELTLANVHSSDTLLSSEISVDVDAASTAAAPPFWPVRNADDTPNHQMLTGFGDGAVNNIYDFHEGIDILASGSGGEKVVVARTGEIVKNEDLDPDPNKENGLITIKVNVGTAASPKFEFDSYLHISDRIDPNGAGRIGRTVTAGTQIGKISSTHHKDGSRHLHFDVAKKADPDEQDFLNPFLRFTDNADRDPLEKLPGLKETNGDRPEMTLYVTKSGQAKAIKTQPIKGNVDLIADVRDQMHDTLLVASAPHKVGYWVKALFDQGVVAHGVKTATNPYILAQFDDNWFSDKPFTKNKHPLVYDDTRRVNPNPTIFDDAVLNFIVTNTKGEDGRVDNVVDQFWNTNAKDDGAADTVAHANYAGKRDTKRNAQARFKDGEYEVHIILDDLIHDDVDATAGKLRLDNFKQKAGAMKGGRDPAPQRDVAPLYDLKNMTPYVPKFMPEISVAKIDTTFFLEDPVGIFGDQYYPNLLMPAYIFPHKKEGWKEDDKFESSNPIAKILVQSDSDGIVPLTKAWTANKSGLFDVIIDYDRDGLFTWTMDGLDGFKVLEKLFEVELRAGIQGSGDYEGAIGPNGAASDNTGQMEIDWRQGPVNWNLVWDSSQGKATFSAAGQTISYTDTSDIGKAFNAFKLVASAQVNSNVPAGSSVNFKVDKINDSLLAKPFSIGAVATGFQEFVSDLFSKPIVSMSGTASISGGTQKGRSALDIKLKAYDPPLFSSSLAASTPLSQNQDTSYSPFDEPYYLSQYEDVAAAVHSDVFNNGFEHYFQFGQREQRNPNGLFNEADYLALNPDVANAVASGALLSGF